MKRLWLIPIGFVALVIPVAVLAGSGQGGFDGVVTSIESRYHVRAMRIPFLGLVSFISRKATQGGVDSLHIAQFEHFTEQFDGVELIRLVEKKLGSGWERIIRETTRRGHEQTLIFIHPEGARMGLFVLNLDGHELDVVQVSVDPDHLNRSIARYEHHSTRDDDDRDRPD
jgi:hypothetical protein